MSGFSVRLWVLSLALLAVGCVPVKVRDASDDRYVSLVGGEVVVHGDLTVAADEARVFLQRGAVVSRSRLDLYTPSCSLELNELGKTDQVIHADRFKILTAGAGFDESVQNGPVRVAALGASLTGMLLSDGQDGGGPMVMHQIQMRLSSQSQPNVLQMTCRGIQDDLADVKKLTLQDMRAALGTLVSIELP